MPTGSPTARRSSAPAPGATERADVDVVVVSYRSRDYVLDLLASLPAAAEGLQTSVTVVDNDSRDGTVAAIRDRFPDVDVVANDRNRGFAQATNTGLARHEGRYVLLLNPDTELVPGTLATLTAFADAHPAAGVVAPRLVDADGSEQQTARAFPTPAAALLGRRSPLTRLFPGNRWSARYLRTRRPAGTEPFQVDWVSGAAMLVPRRVLERVGALDEGFFLFWEDADWCRRIVSAGFEVWCVPEAEVRHDEGGTREHGWSAPTIRWFHQGAYRYWVKHHAPSPWDPLRWAAAALLTARAVVLTAHHGLARRRGARSAPREPRP